MNRLMQSERPDYGIIATLKSADKKVTIAREFPTPDGSVRNALQACARYCDRHGMFVWCLSTPVTIMSDLEGRDTSHSTRKTTMAEKLLLTTVGRVDVLHPEKR